MNDLPRSLEQNARMWAMLTDLSKQLRWPVDGELQYLTPGDWANSYANRNNL